MTLPVVAEVWRSEFLETVHRGSLIVVGPAGDIRLSLGDPESLHLPRSANKPLCAVAMLELGLQVSTEELSIMCGSHTGQAVHLRVVRQLLASQGLREADLGGGDMAVDHPCSGHHAGMLAASRLNGWSLDDYLDQRHPVQLAVLATLERLTGEHPLVGITDGCAAPLSASSLLGLARAYGQLTSTEVGQYARRVGDAMRLHPVLVAGPGRPVTVLMQGIPGLVVKSGADAVYCAALADGTGISLKIEGGSERAMTPLLVAVLRRCGLDAPVLRELEQTPVYGGPVVVGGVVARL
jgi:L-asparaginase II